MNWLKRHAVAIQSLGAIITALVAMAALVGVKLQVDSNARQQREQSARDIYREYLNLSIARPELADADYCAMHKSDQRAAYENYLEYTLYTADQLLGAAPHWEATMTDHLAAHREALCTDADWSDDSPQIQGLVRRFKTQSCIGFVSACPVE